MGLDRVQRLLSGGPPAARPRRGPAPRCTPTDHRHRLGGLAQVVADHLVAHGLDRGRTATGVEHHRRVGDVAEGAVGGDGERSVGGRGLNALGHHRPVLVVELPQAGEDLR